MKRQLPMLLMAGLLALIWQLPRAQANTCTLPKSGACSSGTCNLSATTTTWTGTGCTASIPGNGDTATINDGVTVTVDQDWTIGNSGAPVFSYVSSITVTGGSGYTGTCTITISGGTKAGSGQSDQTASCTQAGGVLSGTLTSPRTWYTGASAAPTCAISGTDGSGASCAVVWQQGGGTAAITFGNTGVVNIGSGRTLTLRGTVIYASGGETNADALTASAGGATIVWDSSQGAALSDGAKPIYSAGAGSAFQERAFNFTGCTSVNRCVVTSCAKPGQCAATGNVGLMQSQHGDPHPGSFKAYYTDFSYIGDAITPAVEKAAYPFNAYDVQHNTMDHSGIFIVGPIGTGQPAKHNYNVHTNSVGICGPLFANFATNTTRQIIGNHFDVGIGGTVTTPNCPASGTTGVWTNATVTDNYFGDTARTLAGAWTSFTGNLVVSQGAGGGDIFSVRGPSTAGNYLLLNAVQDNPHVLGQTNTNVGGWVFDLPEDYTSDSGEIFLGSGDFADSAALSSKTGKTVAAMSACTSALATAINYNHVVFWGSDALMPIQVDESGQCLGGSTYTLKNSAFHGAATGYFLVKTLTPANPTQNICTTCDYNFSDSNLTATMTCAGCTNQGKGYASKWTATPGAHDQTALSARFADTRRRIQTWPTLFLGLSGTAWATSTAYAVGDIVSHSFGTTGLSILFRCKAAHTSGASTEPDTGADWRTKWQYHGEYLIAQAVAAGTTYADGALTVPGDTSCTPASPCSAPRALYNWVVRGLMPQEPRYWCAGNDGSNIGIVSSCAAVKAIVGAISQ